MENITEFMYVYYECSQKMSYSLVEENIVLRTCAKRSPDAVHVSLRGDYHISNQFKKLTCIFISGVDLNFASAFLHDKFVQHINSSQKGFTELINFAIVDGLLNYTYCQYYYWIIT